MDESNDYQKRYESLYRSPHVSRVTVRSSDGKSHVIKRPQSKSEAKEELALTSETSNGLRIRL